MQKAEWYYEGAENGGRVLARDERSTIIHEPPCSPFNEQGIADAKLIAAAPDLLEALGLCLNAVCLAGWEGDFCATKARAAIAKANGGMMANAEVTGLSAEGRQGPR